MIYYVDSSAWIKRYYLEQGTPWIQNLFGEDAVFACATLGIVEVTATLARKRKMSPIDQNTAEQQNQAVTRDWNSFVQIRCTDEIIDAARILARTEALRGADSIHLASALHLQQRLDDTDHVIVVTSDHELATAAKSQGLAVIDPVEQTPSDRTTPPS